MANAIRETGKSSQAAYDAVFVERKRVRKFERWSNFLFVLAYPLLLIPLASLFSIWDDTFPNLQFSTIENIASATFGLIFFGILIAFRIWRSRIDQQACEIIFTSDVPQASYMLLLRSFFVDEMLAPASKITPLGKLGLEQENFQNRITDTLAEEDREFIRIGDRREFLFPGASVTSTDESWFHEQFVRLARHAEFILLCPIVRKPFGGTMKEIGFLKAAGLLERTYLIAPKPRPLYFKVKGKPIARVSRLWEGSGRLMARRFGLKLPGYTSRSAIYEPTGRGWNRITGLHGKPWDHPVALKSLLFAGKSLRSPARDLVEFSVRQLLWFYLIATAWFLRFTIGYLILHGNGYLSRSTGELSPDKSFAIVISGLFASGAISAYPFQRSVRYYGIDVPTYLAIIAHFGHFIAFCICIRIGVPLVDTYLYGKSVVLDALLILVLFGSYAITAGVAFAALRRLGKSHS